MLLKQYILSKLPKAKLRRMCKEHNLPVSGTRRIIIARLVDAVDWLQLKNKQPFELLEWYEKIFSLALLNGTKAKSEILKSQPFKQISDKVEDDKLKTDLCESIFLWSKNDLVKGKIVNYDPQKRNYSLSQEVIDEIPSTSETDFQRIISEFYQSSYARYRLGIGSGPRHVRRDMPIVKYSTKHPAQLNFKQDNDSIRILAFSDWRVQEVDDALLFAKRSVPDVILYGGDDLERFRLYGINKLTELAQLSKAKKVFAVLGNDDFYGMAKQVLDAEGVHDLYDQSVVFGNFAFLGLESSTCGPANFRHEEEDFENHLAQQYPKLNGKNLIILSHTPPNGILDRGIRFADQDEGSHHIGSSALRKFLENNKVSLVVCGHCHSHGGLVDKLGGTTIVNVSSHDNAGAIGKFAVIDLYNNGNADITWHDTNELIDQYSVDRIWGVGFCYRRKLTNSGITTIKELAACDGLNALSHACDISPKVLAKFQLRARSMVENKIFQISHFEFPDSKVIYIDIETDLACSKIWLIGLLIDGELIQLYADNWGEERQILTKFLELLEKYPDYQLVSYSGTDFDYRVPKAALKRHGLRVDLLESHQHFDLSYAIRNCFIFPNQSFALKELGSYLQYPFKHSDMDGMVVAFKYMKHAEDGEPLDKEIIAYNEDDVRVLPFIISTLKSKKLSIFLIEQ